MTQGSDDCMTKQEVLIYLIHLLSERRKMSKTVIDIVKEYLEANGYDGLCYHDECGCDLNELGICIMSPMDCTPGYRIVEDGGYRIVEEKP